MAVPDGHDPRRRETTDRQLVEQALHPTSPAERERAFAAIYARHSAAVLKFCAWRLNEPATAEDVAHDTFERAFNLLKAQRPPGAHDRLRPWLCTIAHHRCQEEWRRRKNAALPDDRPGDDDESASRGRLIEVDRILEIVAATFTEPQQRIFQLSTRRALRGQGLAAALGVSEKEANDRTYENKQRVWQGFGAYVLALHGRPYCPGLARILDQAAWDGEHFTRVLRLRILRHLNDCKTCDDCATCNDRRGQLVGPYAPILIPILAASDLRERVLRTIRRICAEPDAEAPDDQDPDEPEQQQPLPAAVAPAGPKPQAPKKSSGFWSFLYKLGVWLLLVRGLSGVVDYYQRNGGQSSAAPVTLDVWVIDRSLPVQSSPPGLNCTGVCHQQFPAGTLVTLTSSAATGIPLNWVGCDNPTSSTGDPCTVTLHQNRAVCTAPYNEFVPEMNMTAEDCRARASG